MRWIVPVLSVLLLSACGRGPADGNGSEGMVQIKGSDTMVNAAQMLAEAFMKQYPDIHVAVTGGGSGVGIAAMLNKTCDIADSSRDIKPKEFALGKAAGVDIVPHDVAYDGVALIVNKNNPVDKLTVKQLHDIYTGKVKNWRALGGDDLPIVVISREVSSGTHVYFKEEVVELGDKANHDEFYSGVMLFSSSQAIVEEVAQNKSAIGYLGMGYTGDKTKSLKIAGNGKDYYAPTVANVADKQYPLARSLYMCTNGEPQGDVKIFMDFVLSDAGQAVFERAGFVPLAKR